MTHNNNEDPLWGSLAVSETIGLDVLKKSYGSDADSDLPYGQRFTIAADGTVCALVAGDMGYDMTHIVIPREHIIALVEDWPEFEKD
jgi:hypothetical protein